MKPTIRRLFHTRALTAVLVVMAGCSAALAEAPDHELLCDTDATVGSYERASLPLDDEAAEKALRGALTRLAASYPPGHWRLAEVESRLGGVLAARGRHGEAEPMLVRGYITLQTQCSSLDPRTRLALARLADFYRSQASEEGVDLAGGGRWAIVAEVPGADPATEAPPDGPAIESSGCHAGLGNQDPG